ncbi:hypothetical protein GCM10007860_03880 [Chitiniphilus shinanonensis]|uniref:HMA domain-containing protein n=1 Tax=Chitiniphilus shinanonensis TaxID=553088 RepID=A0ABQ6BPZ3_9NEIS|nr:heavy-metal-associated domain-containing protein [Chitiniphilus shinanonensis]GLS03245.1 hypothetical protein GCM10007860_03880 [Chitiniphilus shinanonensis]
MEQINIGISGMSCGGCVASVTRALQALEGVTEVAVTLDPGAAKVTFDPDDTDRRTIESAIEDAGYDVVR